jgi:acyl-CoA thioesterase-1
MQRDRSSDRLDRSYGKRAAGVQTWLRIAALGLALALGPTLALASQAGAADRTAKLVALGDSLTAGYNLPVTAAFPAKLQTALRAKGFAVEIANAGVSGDTASGGLARLDWSVPEGTDAVVLELGANDMLRGIDPRVTRAALDEIIRRLTERHIAVLLAGMRAIPNLGVQYVDGFEVIYPELAAKYDLVYYPFFLESIAGKAEFNQRDGLHPTAAGVDHIVAGILPKAEELLMRLRDEKHE